MKFNRSFMAANILAAGVLITALSLHAQGNSNKAPDGPQADGRGDVIRGAMPHGGAQPGGGNVVTGNGISYHNGPVLHAVNLYFVYYGDWAGLDPKADAIFTDWANHIGGSPYFNINTTYGDTTGNVPNAVTFMGSLNDTADFAKYGTSLDDNAVAAIALTAVNTGYPGTLSSTPGVADPNGLYMVLTAPGVKETSGFITQYCGWHYWGSIVNGAIQSGTITQGAQNVQFAFIGDAAGPSLGNCNGQAQNTTSPNNDPGADAMVSVMSHELEETATDPQGNAWYDARGNENADKCAWTFGTEQTASNGSLYNMTLGSGQYLIQQNWLNAQGGKCVLSWVTTPDFSVSVSGSQTVTPGGTSGNYTLTATPVNGFTGPVTWTITPPAGITASTPAVANTATFTLTAAGNLAPGSYSVPITGQNGSLSHPTSATLVVSAPTFSLTTESPSSQTVTRPASGTKTVTYTIDVNQVGSFATPVTLTVSGGTTGVTPSITSPNPVAPGGKATLSVVVSSNARRATRTITVTGTAGATKKTTTATITIQ